MIPAWLSFIIIIGLILLFSKYELSIILTIGAILFALLSQVSLLNSFLNVITDPTTALLMVAVSLIPILGGIMGESGLILELVEKLNVSKRISMMVTPAIFGLLPIAGGALMSAPLVEQIGTDVEENRKASINIWYRHVVILVYPLSSALIIGSAIAKISLYLIVISMIIPFILLVIIGYFLLVRSIKVPNSKNERDLKIVLINFIPIIIAPIIDFIGRTFFNFPLPEETYLVIGLIISIIVGMKMGNIKLGVIKKIAKDMKLWRFPLLIFGMFLFLEVFNNSSVTMDISALNLPFILFLCVGFFLGYATGRVEVPLPLLIPIYLDQYMVFIMPLLDFVFLYVAIFLGYLITPIHPCISYSVSYFKTTYNKVIKRLAAPALISFGILLAIYSLTLLF
ncbi:MAG: DUF401 family protein [Promethearchaeati archaeon]